MALSMLMILLILSELEIPKHRHRTTIGATIPAVAVNADGGGESAGWI